MAREMNSLFFPDNPLESQHRQQSFSLNDFPSITAPEALGRCPREFVPENGTGQYQNRNPVIQTQFTRNLPMQPIEVQRTVTGFGELTWLSAKAGLITSHDGMTVSFQLKDFCDQGTNDLLQILRVGFTLKFIASHHEGDQYTATSVSPVCGKDAEMLFENSSEIDLEAVHLTSANTKDAYSLPLEEGAYDVLLSAFRRQRACKVQLSSLHSQMSNYADDRIYHYVGTSSMKRRQFIERRTHLFCLQNNDAIILQEPAVYQVVCLLSSHLLSHGGVTSIKNLFDYYESKTVSSTIKQIIGSDYHSFINLLQKHTWVFAIFPNRTYVSARRNLPNFNYVKFVWENFPICDVNLNQIVSVQHLLGVQSTNSVPMSVANFMMPNGPIANRMALNAFCPPSERLLLSQPRCAPFSNHYNGTTSTEVQNSQRVLPSNIKLQTTTSSPENQWNPLSITGTWSNNERSFTQIQKQNMVEQVIGMDYVSKNLLSNEFGNHLSLRENITTSSTSVQADEPVQIGPFICTCQCTCGRGKSDDNTSSSGPRNSAGVFRTSLPNFLPDVMNIGTFGFIGDRPLSISTISSDDPQPITERYNLFASNEVLNGNF